MIFYKLRHIPTGLFFRPSANYLLKNNLSKIGKAYAQRPSLTYVRNGYYRLVNEWNEYFNRMSKKSEHTTYIEGEWEVVKFESKEID